MDALKPEIKLLNKKSREWHLNKKRRKNPTVLPKVDDLNKLVNYAEGSRQRTYEILSEGWDPDAFRDLNESTLLLLQIINRKRQGEISRLLAEDLEETRIYRLNDDCNGDEFTSLSKESQEAARDYFRVSILNKKGLMNVGLIVHKRLLDSLNMIIENRRHDKSIKENNLRVSVAAELQFHDHAHAFLVSSSPGSLLGNCRCFSMIPSFPLFLEAAV